jgi:hypothetical protein
MTAGQTERPCPFQETTFPTRLCQMEKSKPKKAEKENPI